MSNKFPRYEGITISMGGQRAQEIRLLPPKVVILHPSLCAPLVRPAGLSKENPLSLFILTDRDFYKAFRRDHKGEVAGPSVLGLINHFLKIVPWEESRSRKKDIRDDKPLFKSNEQARQHLVCTHLGHLVPGGWKIWDKTGRIFARIHPLARNHFLAKEIIYGFQIDITGGLSLLEGLHDASWVILDEEEKRKGHPFVELQDKHSRELIRNKSVEKLLKPYKLQKDSCNINFSSHDERPIQNHHPIYITNKPQLNIGHLSDVHVSSRQHAFQKSGAQMLQGVSEEVSPKLGKRVNASFPVLKDLMDRFGRDGVIDLLLLTGDLIDYNCNYDPAARSITRTGEIWEEMLLDNLKDPKKYPRWIDNVVVYSLLTYYYDTYKKPIFAIAGNHEAYTLPYGISPRVNPIKGLGASAPKLTPKTVDQTIDQSISDRKGEWNARTQESWQININRANEGIPADHNLTIPEAILLYGPDYDRVVLGAALSGGGQKNFRAENFDWFHTLFCPLGDYHFTYKDQCFIGLGWGEEEKFASVPNGHGPFFLPRAPKSIDKAQRQIIESALAHSKRTNVLFSHFTVVNYAGGKPLSQGGEINGNDTLGSFTDSDHGTFEENRGYLFELLQKGRLHLTLSGRSHRSGLYQPTAFEESIGRRKMRVVARQPAHPSDTGKRPYAGGDPQKPKLIVSASGGPVPVQNYQGELAGQGLERPSGTYIKFNGGSPEIGLLETTIPQAKPRFAVVMDYIDIFGREKNGCGVFKRFESDAGGTSYTIELNPELKLPDMDLLAGIHLVHYSEVPPKILPMTVSYLGAGRYKAVLGDAKDPGGQRKWHLYLRDKILPYPKDPFFIRVCFKPALGSQQGYQQYDFGSPWIFQSEIVPKSRVVGEEHEKRMKTIAMLDQSGVATVMLAKEMGEAVKQASGHVIRRHSKYGEVPNHLKLSMQFPGEFQFNWEKYRKK